MKTSFFCILLSVTLCSGLLQAQTTVIETSNQFIAGAVDGETGLVTVLLPPGRLFMDKQLSFFDKSFFSCQIGSSFFTNNELVHLTANAFLLGAGTTTKIADTIRTIWANKNGVDIIQDIYPVAFTKSGQIVYSWKFHNTTPVAVNAACQYLRDIQITDPTSQPGNRTPNSNSNDGPKILTKFQYDGFWTQFPSALSSNTLPWFYIGFLFDLPGAPAFDPGLSAMGYMDYGAPLNLIKPFRYTNGDWFTLSQTIFGTSDTIQNLVNTNIPIGSDNGILLNFTPLNIPPGQTIEVGRTSYGTGETEQCEGQMFSLVFYPHRIVWDSSTKTFFPNSIHIEKFLTDPGPPENNLAAGNTNVTLTVSKDLTLSTDNTCMNNLGQSEKIPGTPQGVFIKPGGFAYFDWWVCVNPMNECIGTIIDTLTFTATCSNCNPAFINNGIGSKGLSECQLPIILDCTSSATSSVPTLNSNNLLLLSPNHPNPFSHITTFNYTTHEYGAVKLYLYNEIGKEIARIVDRTEAPGNYSVDFDGSQLPAGAYIVRFENGGSVASRKVIIEK